MRPIAPPINVIRPPPKNSPTFDPSVRDCRGSAHVGKASLSFSRGEALFLFLLDISSDNVIGGCVMDDTGIRCTLKDLREIRGFFRDHGLGICEEVISETRADGTIIQRGYGPGGEMVMESVSTPFDPGCDLYSGLEEGELG